jgi:aspartate oxidase
LETGAIAVDAQQATSLDGVFAAGECTGIGGMELAAAEGRIAGLQATGTDVDSAARAERDRWRRFADALEQTFKLDRRLKDLARPDTVICRCEDVTQQELAAEAGWKTAKMEHRCGMGACQGRICGPATEFLFDWRRTSQRLPVFPAHVDTLACGLENAPEGN